MLLTTVGRLRRKATMDSAWVSVKPASAKCGIGGQIGALLLSRLKRKAVSIWVLVQQPSPVAGSGVRLGGYWRTPLVPGTTTPS
jgi:hypothetical protein